MISDTQFMYRIDTLYGHTKYFMMYMEYIIKVRKRGFNVRIGLTPSMDVLMYFVYANEFYVLIVVEVSPYSFLYVGSRPLIFQQRLF